MPLPAATPIQRSAQKENVMADTKFTTDTHSTQDSKLVKLVREGENISGALPSPRGS